MKKVVLCLALMMLILFAVMAVADEGMWPYNAVPKSKIKAKYGLDLNQAWLDHLQMA